MDLKKGDRIRVIGKSNFNNWTGRVVEIKKNSPLPIRCEISIFKDEVLMTRTLAFDKKELEKSK